MTLAGQGGKGSSGSLTVAGDFAGNDLAAGQQPCKARNLDSNLNSFA